MSALIAPTTRRQTACLAVPSRSRPLRAAGAAFTRGDAGQACMSMPFDALRFQYASAVMSGLVPRSILGSAQSERVIDRLEKLILGPLARQR